MEAQRGRGFRAVIDGKRGGKLKEGEGFTGGEGEGEGELERDATST